MNISLDDQLAKSTIDGAKKVFKDYFKTDIKEQNYYFNKGYKKTGDISGLVILQQNNKEGVFVISFKTKTVQEILKNVYGKKPDADSDELREAVGELTNIAYGVAKKELNDRGHNLGMSLPTIIVGKDHTVHPFAAGLSLIIPFSTSNGEFHIQVILEK